MHSYRDRVPAGASRQAGMALIVSLLVLVVITLLTLSATQTSTLQENMAGNLRDHHLAFQAAEAALRAGERQALASGGGNSRLEDSVTLSEWDGSNATGTYVMPDEAGLAADPVFHLGATVPVRVGVELPPRYAGVVPVTARGVGGSPNSVVILRSNVYTTGQ